MEPSLLRRCGRAGSVFSSSSVMRCPSTTLATSPVTREAPYLYVDLHGHYNVFVPAVQRNSSGTTWATGATAGVFHSNPKIFHCPDRLTSADDYQSCVAVRLRPHFLTPGIYNVESEHPIWRPDTVVLGLGLLDIDPNKMETLPWTVAEGKGTLISGHHL